MNSGGSKKKRSGLVPAIGLMLVVLCLVFGALGRRGGAGQEPEPAPTSPPTAALQEISLSGIPTLEGQLLIIVGMANLIDGAMLDYEIMSELFEVPIIEGRAEVAGGQWQIEADLTGWPAGDIEIWVGFQPLAGRQPGHVLELYGATGEMIAGPQAETIGEFTRASWLTIVEISP